MRTSIWSKPQLYELEDFQNAYRVFKSAYAIDSTNAETINGVSISARQLVNFDEAIQFGALAMKKSERTEYYDEYENNQAINYHYKADYMMLNGSAEDSVVARDLFRDALALQPHAFEISGDSAYLMNMGAVMLDSCAGTNAFCDSLARAQFSLGGYLYGKYVSNNFGVLEAIKGNYANAEKYFDQAIVNNDLKYWHPTKI
ncbi:MAG: hypothetical protein IPN72_09950 [Saprospiraceae bacterium]|nr:hypothetical protein [Saprospiraceae bacterium]